MAGACAMGHLRAARCRRWHSLRWTLLVQGVNLHVDAAHELLQRFRFVPDARLDDLMISYASDGGGVGPHFDSYDVFLLQAHGRRRWRIGRQRDLRLVPGLPPRWAHDGVAEDECMTCSIGIRQPVRSELACELLLRLADEADGRLSDVAYRDPGQPAVATPAGIPAPMLDFARDTVQRTLADPRALALVLGEWLTEPKSNVWFELREDGRGMPSGTGLALDRRTRMMHDARHVFINGEGHRTGGRDARLLRALADSRRLAAAACRQLSPGAQALVEEWWQAGWVHEWMA